MKMESTSNSGYPSFLVFSGRPEQTAPQVVSRAIPFPVGPNRSLVWLSSLFDDRLELNQPILASLEFFADFVTAWNEEIEEYGSGESESGALDALRESITETYFLLQEEGEDKLGPLPLRQWRYMTTIIRKI